MKIILFFIVLLFFAAPGFAQIDAPTTTTKAPEGLLAPKTATESSSSLKLPGNHSLSNKRGIFHTEAEPMKLGEKEKKPLNMTTDNGLMTFKNENFTPKSFTKDKAIIEAYKNDQYLGDFKTTGVYVELYCRDHEYVDGDKVRISINGEVVNPSMSLDGTFTPVYVKLNSGLNNIEFEALNQGSSGPNTAQLRVYDDQGREVANKEWNLLTGARASLIVVKQ